MQCIVVEHWRYLFDLSIDTRILSLDSPLHLLTAGFLIGPWRSQVCLSPLDCCLELRMNFTMATSSIRLDSNVTACNGALCFSRQIRRIVPVMTYGCRSTFSCKSIVRRTCEGIPAGCDAYFSDGHSTRPSYPSLGHSFIFHRSDVSSLNTTSAIQASTIDQQATGRMQSAEKNN